MSAVHASGVQTQCRPVSSRNQQSSSFRPFAAIVPRGVAAPRAPLLHRKLISVAPSALGGATSYKVQHVHTSGTKQMHPSYKIESGCRCRRAGGGAGDQTHPGDRAGRVRPCMPCSMMTCVLLAQFAQLQQAYPTSTHPLPRVAGFGRRNLRPRARTLQRIRSQS
jgi:hypothetical protein